MLRDRVRERASPTLGRQAAPTPLCHTSRVSAGNATSPGKVATRCFTDVDSTALDGHTAGRSSAVARCTTRHPSAPSSTRSSTTSSEPDNNVVFSCTPALFLIDSLNGFHDHQGGGRVTTGASRTQA